MYKHMEEMTLNTWPALQTIIYNGWLLRYSNGYTKRANSVSPLYHSSCEDVQQHITYCEQYYTKLNQDVIFKITPYTQPENIDQWLERLGYVLIDESSVRVVELADIPNPTLIANVQESITEDWLDNMAQLNQLSVKNKAITRVMLEKSTLLQGFFTLYQDAKPVACGLGVIQDDYIGLYDIVTDQNYRRNGYGEQLVRNILNWGRSRGAKYSFLQVVRNNEAAIALYNRFGYREVYRYWYRINKYTGILPN